MGFLGIDILWWIIGMIILIIIIVILWKIGNKIKRKEFKENFTKKMHSQEIQQLRNQLMKKTKEELIEDYLKLQAGWSLYKP